MPKKHQQKALLTKPQSSIPQTLSLSRSSSAANQHEPAQRSVNDLIRESRRLQLRNEPRSLTAQNAASIPPSLRAVLDLPPPPPPPAPRLGTRSSGPSRLRRIPGPPPPRSWLTDSIYAPTSLKTTTIGQDIGHRIQVRTSNLPDGSFPPAHSLQHLILKKIASNWEWHAQNDDDYLEFLPTNLKEALLSYIAVYNEAPSNPLRILFLNATTPEDRVEVRRLDLSNGLGLWTTSRQLERDLLVKQGPSVKVTPSTAGKADSSSQTPDSWDTADDSDDAIAPAINTGPRLIHNFPNLRHLSLAISPVNTKAASWSSLLSLAAELRTLTSLSLAYWPQPTFTPNAASTRAVINSPGARPVVYGGSDIYTAHDNDWREAAGILRTLSRSLYCLKWLDLTGCGDWFAALEWTSSSSGVSSSEKYGPEWNGGWRGLDRLVLEVGWKPVPPLLDESAPESDESSWNVENERELYRFNKERQRFAQFRGTAQSVARHLRSIRKNRGGKWIEVDFGEELSPESLALKPRTWDF
ncbi:hypothetical protein PV11_04299 [Exophiala sideris]|uniref:Tafazzin n=1 Tax=Exophiala sideris TaxID=1016849 RepID=A0A0D1X3L7_9EURO|nr:hypothetical protein PV11_04299 [Exophiala sideris]